MMVHSDFNCLVNEPTSILVLYKGFNSKLMSKHHY